MSAFLNRLSAILTRGNSDSNFSVRHRVLEVDLCPKDMHAAYLDFRLALDWIHNQRKHLWTPIDDSKVSDATRVVIFAHSR